MIPVELSSFDLDLALQQKNLTATTIIVMTHRSRDRIARPRAAFTLMGLYVVLGVDDAAVKAATLVESADV